MQNTANKIDNFNFITIFFVCSGKQLHNFACTVDQSVLIPSPPPPQIQANTQSRLNCSHHIERSSRSKSYNNSSSSSAMPSRCARVWFFTNALKYCTHRHRKQTLRCALKSIDNQHKA